MTNVQTAQNISSLGVPENAQPVVDFVINNAMTWAVNTVSALLILIIGLIAASWAKKSVRGLLTKTGKVDAILVSFLSSLARYGILAIVIIMVLSRFGVQTTSLAAILGAAGLAIGLAMQGTLSHVASGVMIMIFRPFSIGDFVSAGGEEGSVRDITLFTTELATPDNKKIIIPNGKVWDDTIINFSANKTRRLDLVFGISYDDDIGKARAIIQKLVDADDRIHSDPEPVIEVDALNDFSVDFTVRVWLDGGDYFKVKWELNRKLKETFDQEGVSIPFPTQTHIQVQG